MGHDVESFVEAIRPRLVGSLTLYCGDRQAAEDLAQEALVRAWMKWRKVVRMNSPEAWTYRTAFNLATSWGRRGQAERRAVGRLADRAASTVSAAAADPTDVIAVADAVVSLASRQRTAIICRYYLGLGVDEAADAMGCRPGTVKALTSQGISRLRQLGLVDEEVADV